MRELWDATRPFAGWAYLGALVVPALLGAVWWAWQLRGRGGEPMGLELLFLAGAVLAIVITLMAATVRTVGLRRRGLRRCEGGEG